MKQRQRFSDEDESSVSCDSETTDELAVRRSEAQGSVRNISELIDRVLSTDSESFLEATRQRGGE